MSLLILTPFLPCVVGLVPVLLARSWPARLAAGVFGVISLAFGAYLVWGICHTPFQRLGVPVIGGLSTALLSAVVTYVLDRRYVRKV
jgi:hypothetical protein